MEEEPEDVPGSLRHAVKEAEGFDKWIAANRGKNTGSTEYWAIAEDMKKCIKIEAKLDISI